MCHFVVENFWTTMPQNEHIERHTKLWGKRYDADEKKRKKEARAVCCMTELGGS